MNGPNISLKEWLVSRIMCTLERDTEQPPLLLWCDPQRQWPELLDRAAKSNFELWADEEDEMVLRERFYAKPRKPRVVWIPRSREDITWFKVFELQAEEVWEKDLVQALREYDVSIPRDQEDELKPLLPAHAAEWFDRPKHQWKELTVGTAKSTLVDDDRVLQAIAGGGGEFSKLREEGRFGVFARRITEDFGLPDPRDLDERKWRVMATAGLLCTEAAEISPDKPPSDKDRIVPVGAKRKNALRLLRSWKENVRFIPSFEQLVPEADATLSLRYWVENLPSAPPPLSSRAIEEVLFHQYVNRADQIEELDTLAKELSDDLEMFETRELGFWDRLATKTIGWGDLRALAEAARLLVESRNVEKTWKTPGQAVDWYVETGWRLDSAGGALFEDIDLPDELNKTRTRLRRAYIRTIDRIGRAFSELMDGGANEDLGLPTAGEVALSELESSQMPTALIFLDACRYEYGQRLAETVNRGEPATRAEVSLALAPLPSITPLGMAFALPIRKEELRVQLEPKKGAFQILAEGFQGDLSLLDQRRKWLQEKLKADEFLTPKDVLSAERTKQVGLRKTPKIAVVHADEFDRAGHEGELQLKGASDYLDRYARIVRALRDRGFRRVIILTDHGFFHWEPEKDEVEDKPDGERMWASRRAIVGRNLSHRSALKFQVTQSDLEVMVPRSTNAFKTYGGLGYFHGGATLQELLIPVIVARWPAKATKVKAVLKPIDNITSEVPRVQVEAGLGGQQKLIGPDEKLLARRVLIKIRDPSSGKLIFKHDDPATIEPGGEKVTIQLRIVEPKPTLGHGTPLEAVVIDADDEEILDRENVVLRLDIDEW